MWSLILSCLIEYNNNIAEISKYVVTVSITASNNMALEYEY